MERCALLIAALGACGCGPSSDLRFDASPEVDALLCGAQRTCDGVCVQADSCDFSVTSVEPPNGPMNGGNFVTLRGHGFAAGLRVDLGDGRCVVRVVDAATVLIQPPPGPHQDVDVKVTLGGKTAVLPGGYRYASGVLGQTWEKKEMATPRGVYPGLALLQDGRMLVAGGAEDSTQVSLATADIYDPGTGTASPAANDMTVGRIEPAAVTLMNGKVLLVGDYSSATNQADLFDPKTSSFAPSASGTAVARKATIGVLLVDGRVLLVSRETPSAELYDPDLDRFTALAGAPAVADQYDQPWPVRLRDGRVLIVKGKGRTCSFFDPGNDSFTDGPAGPQAVIDPGSPREVGITVAADGRVFVVGGIVDPIFTPTSAIAVFDPASGAGFVPLPTPLAVPREAPGVTLLGNGQIIAMGGNTDPSPTRRSCSDTFQVSATVDVIDPAANSVTAFAPLPEANWTLSAATLIDGSLIAAGGTTCGGAVSYPYLYFMQGTPIL